MPKPFQEKADPAALCMKARALISRGEVEKALDLYDKAIEANPRFPTAYADRGTVHAMTRQHAKAVEDLNCALALGYSDGSLFTTLATAQKELGDFPGALKTFSQAAILNPDNPLVYYNRAGVHLALGNKALAISDLEKCLEFRPDEKFRAAIAKRLEQANTLP